MRILIAEDDPKLLKSLVHIFEMNHYAVDGVDNGNDAFDFASSDEYDGLVLDIMMPGMDGVTMINDHLYEGRFTPRVNGKRISKNVYAKTREECEEKLAELIKTMKAEITEMKKAANS